MQASERPDGWLVTYQRDAPENVEAQKHALETLLVSMRSGYSASEMLRCWGFSGSGVGTINWEPPTMSDDSRIWVDLLQRPHSLTAYNSDCANRLFLFQRERGVFSEARYAMRATFFCGRVGALACAFTVGQRLFVIVSRLGPVQNVRLAATLLAGDSLAMGNLRKFFSRAVGLNKSQFELDFVDVPVRGDLPLFIDPFAISQRREPWAIDAHGTIMSFFDRIVQAIRSGDSEKASDLLAFLREPNETRFGYSKGKPKGAGIGHFQANQLLQALESSSAVQTGLLMNLAETELMVEGISWDKMSDLTTNVIRRHLAKYTKDQCDLHSIETQAVALAPCYDPSVASWVSDYLDLPVVDGSPVLLVPKVIARYRPAYDHEKYYGQFVLTFLQAEHLEAGSSLVHVFKNGRATVFKKDLRTRFPGTKEYLFRFSKDNPTVLKKYREELERLEAEKDSEVDQEDEKLLAEMLAQALEAIPAGSADASTYHSLIVGIVEFVFFPNLGIPRKEKEIHQGRKRIDIVVENGARDGIFLRLHRNRGLPCAFVAIECKNYRTEVGNPELDQLAGRFSPNRGQIGFLVCREFEDRALFIERCRDTFKDQRGLIAPLDDRTFFVLLEFIRKGRRSEVDSRISRLIDEVWVS